MAHKQARTLAYTAGESASQVRLSRRHQRGVHLAETRAKARQGKKIQTEHLGSSVCISTLGCWHQIHSLAIRQKTKSHAVLVKRVFVTVKVDLQVESKPRI